MFDVFRFNRRSKEVDGPTSEPGPATERKDGGGFNLLSDAGKFFQDAGRELGEFGGAVGGIFGLNKQDSPPAPPAQEPSPPPAPELAAPALRPAAPTDAGAALPAAGAAAASPAPAAPPPATPIPAAAAAAASPAPPEETPPAPPPAGAGAGAAYAELPQEVSSEDIVIAKLESLPPRPEFGIGPVFERSIGNSTKKVESGVKKIKRGFDGGDDNNLGNRAADILGGVIHVSAAVAEGFVRTTVVTIPGAIGELENLANPNEKREGGGDEVPASDTKHHLVSSNLENIVIEGSRFAVAPLEIASGLLNSENTDKPKVLTDGLTGAIANAGGVLKSIVGASAGTFGIDIHERGKEDEERKRKEAEEKAKKEAEEAEKAIRKAKEEAERKAEEVRKIGKDIPEADADDQKKTNKDTDFADKSPEFKSLFYIADDPDRYSKGFDESTRGNSILMRSKFELNKEGVNSVTFFENVNVESRKSGTFFGTKKRTTENGKKEVVFVGDKAFNAQNKMYEEYFENAKKILELKAKVEKYNQGKNDDEKIELGDLCDIKEQKDFNFLVKDEKNKNIVNSPLKQRIDKIRGIIGSNSLPELVESEEKKIEKEANDFAKILLVEQVKNNCLYTQDDDGFKEAKRINIFRGKKDFKTGKSVTEVKFGSSCVEKDFALIPVGDKQLNLFCKVSHNGDGNAKLEYFKIENNELKLLKYEKSVNIYGSNLRYDDKGVLKDVLVGKKEIIKAIEGHRIDVSWANEVSNTTVQLNADNNASTSVGGVSESVPKKDEQIKSFGSQSYVIKKQKEYQLKSRNTADWWNGMGRALIYKPYQTKHSDGGFSVKEKDIKLSSTGAFSSHNNDDEKTKQKILASEFQIDVKLDENNKIFELNTQIDFEKNPNLKDAMKILNGLKIEDGKIQDPSSTQTTEGIDNRYFRKPTGFRMLPDSLSGEVKQGGSMVVNMNVFDNDGNKKSRIRVEFGVENMRPGLITTGDKMVIKSVSKIDKDRETKWVESIKKGSDDTAKAPTL